MASFCDPALVLWAAALLKKRLHLLEGEIAKQLVLNGERQGHSLLLKILIARLVTNQRCEFANDFHVQGRHRLAISVTWGISFED